MQYKYNKDTNFLELVNRNSIIVNNVISSGTGVALTVTTDEEDFYGKTVNLTDGNKIITSQFSNEGIAVFNNVDMEGDLTVEITVGEEKFSSKIEVKSKYNLELNKRPRIYGVYWNGSSNQIWTRTEDSEILSEPNAALGELEGFSSFDNIYPWSEMKIIEHPIAGTCVKIPKFYYKTAQMDKTLSIKITKNPLDNYSICPACMDRGDGKGERDYILIGRYLCSKNYKSETNELALVNQTIGQFRNGIASLGQGIFQFDYMAYMTICMLYLVEYAHWNSQLKIGFGSGNGSKELTGATDIMKYHTGTPESSRNSQGRVQYRNIEDLWSYKHYFCDGIYHIGLGSTYIIKDPVNFGTEGGTEVFTGRANSGSYDSQYITQMSFSTVPGFDWCMIPTGLNSGSSDTYIGDAYYSYDQTSIDILGDHGNSNNSKAGLFYNGAGNNSSHKASNVAARLMVLP